LLDFDPRFGVGIKSEAKKKECQFAKSEMVFGAILFMLIFIKLNL